MGLPLAGQERSSEPTDSLRAVDVFAPKYVEQQSQSDRVEQGAASAATYLEKLGNANVMAYAPGAVTSLSLGGAQSAHTQALWHHLPLTSYASGALDLTLVPAVLLQPASFQSGTAGNWDASNALAGSYQLGLSFRDTGYSTQFSANSLGYQALSVRGSGAFLTGAYAGYVRRYQSDNTYNYQLGNLSGKVEGMGFAGTDVLQEFHYLNGSWHHSFGWWLTESQKNNSGSILVNREPSQLLDRSARLFYSARYLQHTLSIGYNNEWQNFVDQFFSINDTNTYRQWAATYRWTGRHWIMQYDQQYLVAGGSSRDAKLYLPTLSMTRRWSSGYSKLLLLYQRSWQLGMSQHYQFSKRDKGYQWYTQMGSYVRMPTLNDLYWQPGGNPELKVERSYGVRLGTSKQKTFSKWNGYLEPMFYQNLIQWTPTNNGIWSPSNVKEVLAATLFMQYKQHSGNWSNTIEGGYYYNRILRSALINDPSIGKRTVYTPLYKLVWTSEWTVPSYGALQWRSTLLGPRFSTRDNAASGRMQTQFQTDLLWSWMSKKERLTLLAGVKNLTNTNVQYFPYFPMPGRHFTVELKLSTKP